MAGLTVRSEDGAWHLAGEFDLAEVEAFEQLATAALAGRDDIVLDLTGLAFIDSSGLQAIARLARGRVVVLRNPRGNVRRVLDLVKFDDVPGIEIDPNVPV